MNVKCITKLLTGPLHIVDMCSW